MADDAIAAILDQLAAHADKMSTLDARQAGQMAALTSQLAALAARIDQQLATAAAQPDEQAAGDAEAEGPAASRRWWRLQGQDRAEAIEALRQWVQQVYRPGYGQFAAALAPCWDEHPLCLYAIDILAGLWSVLYLPERRNPAILSAQAEYQARILPALAEQMTAETTRCPHVVDRLPAGLPPRRQR